MLVSEFDFELPPDLIAQEPPAARGASRLLRVGREDGALGHHAIRDLSSLLEPGALLVVNNTQVFPARLVGRRDPSGGAVECLLVTRVAPPDAEGAELWEALVSPGQKLKPGARVVFAGAATIHGEILERRPFGRRIVRLRTGDGTPLEPAVDAVGHIPLPPYIKRDDRCDDHERYQTVFAQTRGSIAAPTAGLHFTPELLADLGERGVECAELTLHVGYGTFQPVRVDVVEEHRMESEPFDISEQTASAVNAALDTGRRVVAVGTTTTRTLESVALANGGRLVPGRGTSNLFIYPGFEFRVVRGLVTNFHLPQSSLLMLVSAFGGRDRVLHAYRTAVAERYRFYSYGDAMLIL